MLHPFNRHLFIADNLHLLRRLDNETVDLICIDPPFAKNQTFTGSLKPPLTDAERELERETLAAWSIHSPADAANAGIEWPDSQNNAKFQDIWRWENDVHEDWISRIEDDYPALSAVIDSTRRAHSESMAAYLVYMAIRIIEMRRVLKPSGSIYIHCDPTAGPYLRAVMDSVCGADKFKAEITWVRTFTHSDSRSFGNVSDTILFYGSDVANLDAIRMPLDKGYVNSHYRHEDKRGAYQDIVLTGPGLSQGESGQPWHGYDPGVTGRCWSVPKTGKYASLIDEKIIPGYKNIVSILERLDALDQADMLHYTQTGSVPRLKRYLESSQGQVPNNVWDDIPPLNSQSNERTGYPTQKPVALAERIILASSNPREVVLDCFAGCAYVPVAAERNGRQWIACDISPRALTVLRRQFAKFQYAVDGTQNAEQPALFVAANVITRSPHDLPERTDDDPAERQDIKELPERKYKVPSSLIPEKEMLEYLLKLSGYKAWCCGFANRRPNGAIVETTNNFHLDHIDPKSKDGSNQIWNRAPLCPAHNVRKNNRRVHLAEYREEIANAGEMLVDTTADLINLAWSEQQAVDYYSAARSRQP